MVTELFDPFEAEEIEVADPFETIPAMYAWPSAGRDAKRAWPDNAEFNRQWINGQRWCSYHEGFVRAELAHEQMGCPCLVFCCRDCLDRERERQGRPAPEPRIEIKVQKAPPPLLAGLWAEMGEDE